MLSLGKGGFVPSLCSVFQIMGFLLEEICAEVLEHSSPWAVSM